MIVDEAYGDFIEGRSPAINLNYDDLIAVRPHSKGLGLARLGAETLNCSFLTSSRIIPF